MTSPNTEDVLHGFDVVKIRKCTRCGETGDPAEEYDVRGIARIGGNLCVDCVRDIKTEGESR